MLAYVSTHAELWIVFSDGNFMVIFEFRVAWNL